MILGGGDFRECRATGGMCLKYHKAESWNVVPIRREEEKSGKDSVTSGQSAS